ncbi:hypothetical protein MC885_015300, partial [Smutsia gigantea]
MKSSRAREPPSVKNGKESGNRWRKAPWDSTCNLSPRPILATLPLTLHQLLNLAELTGSDIRDIVR